MKIVFKHILRNIKEKKGRSILIIISLLIASTVLILNLTIPNQIVEANKKQMRSSIGKSDILVGSYEPFNINDINLQNDDINYVSVNQNSFIHKDKTFIIYGTNPTDANKLNLINTNNIKDDEIILNKTTANKFNYKVNDIFTINIDNNIYNLKISKILDNKGLLFFKTYSGVININTYNKIFMSDINKYDTYYIDVINNDNIKKYSKYIYKNNNNIISQELVDEDIIKENNSYVSMMLIIIFVMAVIMIFFVVNTLNKIIVLERISVIATFRSIGATKKKMNYILILENATYGLIGGSLGALISLLINNICVKLLLGGETLHTTIPISNLIIGIIFSIILEIAMSISAIINSNKYSIKQLMFDKSSSKYELNIKGTIINLLLIIISILLYLFTSDKNILLDLTKITIFWIGIANIIPLIMQIVSKVLCIISKKLNNGSLIIASKNLGYNKMIISSSRLVVISISIMLVIFNISSRFDNMLDSFSYQFQGYDLFIRDTTKQNEVYEELKEIDGVDKVDSVFTATSDKVYNYGKKMKEVPIILGMSKSRPDIKENDYKIKNLKENEALVDNIYLENNNLKIGDTIKLKLDGYKGERTFKLVGTVNSFYYSIQREIIVINEDYFTRNLSNVPFQITISKSDNTDIKDVINKIEHKLKDPDITIMTVDEFVDSQRSNVHTIMSLFYIIIGLALFLSFIGIINNQIISFMERTKELAVLNSVCMSKSQLKRMLLIENITSNVVACIIGFIVSVMSVKLINSVLNGIKIYIDVTFNIGIALIFIGIVLLILILTVILPIIKLKKINIVEAIKYE